MRQLFILLARKKMLAVIILYSFLCANCYGMENAFYILRSYSDHHIKTSPASLNSLRKNHRSIHLLISQAYHIDEKGVVSGEADPSILEIAQKYSIKVMALVTNSSFNKEKIVTFLNDETAQKQAIQSILNECKQHAYYGVQFDFENIPIAKKAELTKFYSTAAQILHQHGYTVSFAVVPLTHDISDASAYLKRKYQNWIGAYDLEALGKVGDFVTIMAYDQHTSGTTPGPTASIHYVDLAIRQTLKFIPPRKVSLGIPVYSHYWFTDVSSHDKSGRILVNLDQINYKSAQKLLEKHRIKTKWDNIDKVNYAKFENNLLNEYLFIEDAKSFKAKLSLAKKYHLRGISVFDLGSEDPNIWKIFNRD